MKLNDLLRKTRTDALITQHDIAQKLGYDSTQFVSLMERGISKVPPKSLRKIAKAYGVPFRTALELYHKDAMALLQKRVRSI